MFGRHPRRWTATWLSTIMVAALSAPVPCPPSSSDSVESGVRAPVNIEMVLNVRTVNARSYAGVWGIETAAGRELALVAADRGLWVYECTAQPSGAITAREIAWFDDAGQPGALAVPWRDVTAIGQVMLSVGQGHRGLRVIDLSNPEDPVDHGFLLPDLWDGAHTLDLDPDTELLYVNGARKLGQPLGMLVLDVARAAQGKVTLVTAWTGTACVAEAPPTRVLFGSYIRHGRAYVGDHRPGTTPVFRVLDVSDPQQIDGRCPLATLPGVTGIPHSSWASDDRTLLLTANEGITTGDPTVRAGHVALWDIANLARPELLDVYGTALHSVHNVFGIGRTGYLAHFTDGVHIVDLSDPTQITAVATFDTTDTPPGNQAGPLSGIIPLWASSYHGVWDVYPWQSSGLIYASDAEHGLFVLRANLGHFNRYGNGVPLANGRVPVLAPERATPRAGAQDFHVKIKGLLPNQPFWLAGSNAPDPAGTVEPLLGVPLWVRKPLLFGIPVQADANGEALVPLPLPDPSPLDRLYLQVVQFGPAPGQVGSSRGTWFGINGALP